MKYSIIIPVYNAAQYIMDCLGSIFRSTQVAADMLPDLAVEVFCVDDGSTDGSGKILDDMKISYGKAALPFSITVLHQQNKGVSSARNLALKQASGDYVCFVDADDVVQPEWIMRYAMTAMDTGADVIRIDGENGLVNSSNLKDWLWGIFVLDGYPWKYAIRRCVAQTALFPDGVAMSEDSIYAARIVEGIRSAAELGNNYYTHVVRSDSAMFRRLCSKERFNFLSCLVELTEHNHCINKCVISKLVAEGLLSWMSRPADVENRHEIRCAWLKLKNKCCADVGVVNILFRLPYWLYAKTGLIWPTRIWSYCIKTLVAIKKSIKQ